MTEKTRAEIVRQVKDLAKLSRDIERAGKVAPRHRLDATVEASKRYEEALLMLRYFLYQRTNLALSA